MKPLSPIEQAIKDLPPMQASLLYALRNGKDISIRTLYGKVDPGGSDDWRWMQQRLGGHFSKMNLKIAEIGYKIAPGVRRRTYRLWRIT